MGGTAKPAADRSYDQIEAQRGTITLSGGSSQAYDEKLNGILNGAHAVPFVAGAVTVPDNLSTRRGYAIAAQPGAVTLPDNLSTRRGYAIAAQPGAVTLPDNLSTRRGYAIAAQPGAVTLPDNLSTRRGYAIAAQPGAVTLPDNLSTRRGYAIAAQPGKAAVLSSHDIRALNARLNAILDGAHATPYAGDAPGLPFSATSGTFHPGKPAPITGDRVGGP